MGLDLVPRYEVILAPEASVTEYKPSEIAAAAGVNVETVRFYERKGVMPLPERLANGYRSYSERDVARLRFIQRAKNLGFALLEIAELLHLRHGERTRCGEVAALADLKLQDVRRRLKEMQRIEKMLASLVES